jgi:hypothetical protein
VGAVQRAVEAVQSRVVAPFRDRIIAPLREQLTVERNNAALLAESVADLERQLHDPEWVRFAAAAQQEFSPEGIRQIRMICRLYTIKNPLLKRGAALRSAYVWGQGVQITARANGKQAGEQDVQAVVTAFMDDPGNQRVLTSAQAQNELEHALYTDGEKYIACFTNPRTGRVQVRSLPCDEIVDILANPEDASEPWFYRRRWTQVTPMADGSQVTENRDELYPAIDYRPATRRGTYAGITVRWDAPVYHEAVNKPSEWDRGIPDAYAAIDWARAYKVFLEDWATVVKALSRFAFRMTSKGSARAQARQALAAAAPRDPATGRALDAGGTAVTPMDAVLEAIPKSGATIDADSGRPLAAMVAAALGVPVTMLLGDPGTTGARATAETLDKPTELEMGQRRQLHTAMFRRILAYVITEAVRAPQGPLQGSITRDPYTTLETLTLTGDTSTVIDIDWPDLTDTDVATIVKAIVEANSTGTIPPEQTLRMVLTALGVRDVDDLVEAMLDDDGEFQWPKGPSLGTGSEAAALARRGEDPTSVGPGPMEDPDDPPDDDPVEEEPASDEEDEDGEP